jgi:hypothetical protein
MEHTVGTARGFAEMMAYEFGRERELDVQTSEKIEQAISSSGDLLLSINSWPHEIDSDSNSVYARQLRTALAVNTKSSIRQLPVESGFHQVRQAS